MQSTRILMLMVTGLLLTTLAAQAAGASDKTKTSDSLAAISIGSLGAGSTVNTRINIIMTSAVNVMFFSGSVVQAVAEPKRWPW